MKSVIGMGNALTDILINLKTDEVLERVHAAPRQHESGRQRPATPNRRIRSRHAAHAVARRIGIEYDPGHGPHGVRTGYVGKVGRDTTGDFFEQALVNLGIEPHILRGNERSGRCVSLVSADGERTMCTFLGAALEMRGDELNESLFDGYDCLYIEGYLVQDHELIGRAVRLAKACGLTVALDLASFNIVDENLGFLNELTDGYVDVLFANEQEAFSFTGERNPLEALDKISRKCPLAVVKVGTQGAYIKHRGKVDHVGIMAEAKRVDTTGAGDFYAAGFLVGLTRGLSMVQCGTIGAIAAGRVIEVTGTTLADETWTEIDRLIRRVEAGGYLF